MLCLEFYAGQALPINLTFIPILCLGRYSGTSADLYNTCFDLLISVKFFLGRFDMRTLQVT